MHRYRFMIGVALLSAWIGHPSIPPTVAGDSAPIDRAVGAVQLGMTVEAFQKAVKGADQSGMNPGLIEGEQSFEVLRESLPAGIRLMGCRFLHRRLYRISVEYREGTFDEARWDALIKTNMERYGKVPIETKILGERPFEFVEWNDSRTRMVLQRELRMRLESNRLTKRYRVVMILLDLALWNERQEAEGSLF